MLALGLASAAAFALGLAAMGPQALAQESTRNFFFFWPEVTRQCQVSPA